MPHWEVNKYRIAQAIDKFLGHASQWGRASLEGLPSISELSSFGCNTQRLSQASASKVCRTTRRQSNGNAGTAAKEGHTTWHWRWRWTAPLRIMAADFEDLFKSSAHEMPYRLSLGFPSLCLPPFLLAKNWLPLGILCLFSTSWFLLTSNLAQLWLIVASPVSFKLVTFKFLKYTAWFYLYFPI